jgi:hypothetical protein
MIHTFYNLSDFKAFAHSRGQQARRLGSHPEDHLEHWYAGDDFWFFDTSGGDLMVENGYFCLDTSRDGAETFGEFMTRTSR